MKTSWRIAFSAMIACGLLSAALGVLPVHAEVTEDSNPPVCFEYCALGFAEGRTGPDGVPYHCLNNDLFYIEYPGTWYFGSSGICPIVFYDDSEVKKTIHNFESFVDASLSGSGKQVDRYVRNGGLDPYLKQVLNIRSSSGYQFDNQTNDDGILVYFLRKDGEAVASIIIWTSFGQVSIRDERSDAAPDPARDYGSIMVMPVADSEDLSSPEAIQAFVDSGKLNDRLKMDTSILTWTTKAFQTEHHNYLLCEGAGDFLDISVYIPVAPAGSKKWLICFEACKESEISYNAYHIRDDIIKTFRVLK